MQKVVNEAQIEIEENKFFFHEMMNEKVISELILENRFHTSKVIEDLADVQPKIIKKMYEYKLGEDLEQLTI